MNELKLPPVAMIGVPGGPSAGTSLLMERIHSELSDQVLIVAESATQCLAAGLHPSPDKDGLDTFQEVIWRNQLRNELFWGKIAKETGRKALILDRTLIDGAAYIPGGMTQHATLMGTTPEHLYNRYFMVVYMESVAVSYPDLYNPDANNLHRLERTAQEAAATCRATSDVYRGHHNFTYIPSVSTAQEKTDRAFNAIKEALNSLA